MGLLTGKNGDRHAITPAQGHSLAELISRPVLYYQRCVEEVSFSEAGGQCWVRNLQIKVPQSAAPSRRAWRVISLGDYSRRRFPDFAVETSQGEKLNLLTRSQHGWALADALVTQSLYGLTPKQNKALRKNQQARVHSRRLKHGLYKLLTSAGDMTDEQRRERATEYARPFVSLLRALGLDPRREAHRLDKFATVLLDTMKVTRYLCWVEAEPGDVVNLRVTYTVEDPKHRGDHSFLQEVADLWHELRQPGGRPSEVFDEWFQEFGLAPIPYKFQAPSSQHAASYYFTVKPPRHSHVTYLCWGAQDADDDMGEIDCSLPSAHVHVDDDSSEKRGKTVRAYVRSAPHHHKQLLGVTVLNLVLVYLLAAGLITQPTGASAQTILLLTPTVFIAYLAHGQRHYYARAHRPQRAILWFYLFFSLGFVVAVTFSPLEGAGPHGLGLVASVFAGAVAISSAAVLAWNLLLGPRWERVMRKRQQKAYRREEAKSPPKGKKSERGHVYDGVVHRYSVGVFTFMSVAVVIASIGFALVWNRTSEEGASRRLPPRAESLFLRDGLQGQPRSSSLRTSHGERDGAREADPSVEDATLPGYTAF